jgi:peroxiredoxin
MRKPGRKILFPAVFAAVFAAAWAAAGQTGPAGPAQIGQPLPEFSLPVLQGGEIALSSLRGRRVMLVFPRGLAGEDHWCHVCHYQYAELAELERLKGIRDELDLEILFVLPYSLDKIREWSAAFPRQLEEIEQWKNPPDPGELDERGRARMERIRGLFPRDFHYEEGKVPLPFPILADGERALTGPRGIFTTEWGGSRIEQNVPTILILDREGRVQFKYISQNTFDRPSPEYLVRFIRSMMGD